MLHHKLVNYLVVFLYLSCETLLKTSTHQLIPASSTGAKHLNYILAQQQQQQNQSSKRQALRACETSVTKMHILSESCSCVPAILHWNVVKMKKARAALKPQNSMMLVS